MQKRTPVGREATERAAKRAELEKEEQERCSRTQGHPSSLQKEKASGTSTGGHGGREQRERGEEKLEREKQARMSRKERKLRRIRPQHERLAPAPTSVAFLESVYARADEARPGRICVQCHEGHRQSRCVDFYRRAADRYTRWPCSLEEGMHATVIPADRSRARSAVPSGTGMPGCGGAATARRIEKSDTEACGGGGGRAERPNGRG